MMRLGYAEGKPDAVRLSDLQNGEALDGDSHVSAFLASRLDFDVQTLEIPHVPEKEEKGLIRYRLRALYPGTPDETIFDYRTRPDGARKRVVVFISSKTCLERYRSTISNTPVLLPYCLIERMARALRNVRVWFCHSSWLELSVFRDGFLVSCNAFRRTSENEPDCARLDADLPEEVRTLPALVVASESEIVQIRESMRGGRDRDGRFSSYEELVAMQKRVSGLFPLEKRAPFILTPVVRILSLSAVVTVLGMLLFFKQLWLAEVDFARLEKARAELESQSRQSIAIEKESDELSASLFRLETKRPRDVYLLLSELSRVLQGEVQIRSLVVQDDSFQVEARGSNPLRLMEGFHESASFSGLKLSQVVPDAGSGGERFSFTGEFHAR